MSTETSNPTTEKLSRVERAERNRVLDRETAERLAAVQFDREVLDGMRAVLHTDETYIASQNSADRDARRAVRAKARQIAMETFDTVHRVEGKNTKARADRKKRTVADAAHMMMLGETRFNDALTEETDEVETFEEIQARWDLDPSVTPEQFEAAGDYLADRLDRNEDQTHERANALGYYLDKGVDFDTLTATRQDVRDEIIKTQERKIAAGEPTSYYVEISKLTDEFATEMNLSDEEKTELVVANYSVFGMSTEMFNAFKTVGPKWINELRGHYDDGEGTPTGTPENQAANGTEAQASSEQDTPAERPFKERNVAMLAVLDRYGNPQTMISHLRGFARDQKIHGDKQDPNDKNSAFIPTSFNSRIKALTPEVEAIYDQLKRDDDTDEMRDKFIKAYTHFGAISTAQIKVDMAEWTRRQAESTPGEAPTAPAEEDTGEASAEPHSEGIPLINDALEKSEDREAKNNGALKRIRARMGRTATNRVQPGDIRKQIDADVAANQSILSRLNSDEADSIINKFKASAPKPIARSTEVSPSRAKEVDTSGETEPGSRRAKLVRRLGEAAANRGVTDTWNALLSRAKAVKKAKADMASDQRASRAAEARKKEQLRWSRS